MQSTSMFFFDGEKFGACGQDKVGRGRRERERERERENNVRVKSKWCGLCVN